jgi:hypothetical protein
MYQVTEPLHLAYDREASSELHPKYFVYNDEQAVVYKGTYAQCLVVIGGLHLGYTMNEIKDKTEDFISEK